MSIPLTYRYGSTAERSGADAFTRYPLILDTVGCLSRAAAACYNFPLLLPKSQM